MEKKPTNTLLPASPTISKLRPGSKSMDYAFLREEGLAHIQRLAGKIWTDYNTHDPGMTILEMLCYAITDIGYRIAYPIEDILASQPDGAATGRNDFFTAHQVLPNSPYTPDDFRKLLIDRAGIRNAWLEKAAHSEIAIYYDPDNGSLNYRSGDLVPLNGLYIIRLEFEDSKQLRSEDSNLNTNIISDFLDVSYGFGDARRVYRYTLEVAMPYWDDISDQWRQANRITAINLEDEIVAYGEERYEDYYAEFTIEFDSGKPIKNFKVDMKLSPPIDVSDTLLNNQVKKELEAALTSTEDEPKKESIFCRYKNKMMAIQEILQDAQSCLHAHRNLCEDFLAFKAIKIQEIAISADIEMVPEADANEVLALIFCAIDNFFSPAIRFYTLQELLDEGQTPDEIFEGPLLTRGFIKTEELEPLKRQNTLYTSDLVRVVMNIPQVKAINNLTISTYIDNQEIIQNEANCLQLPPTHRCKPVLSIKKCLEGIDNPETAKIRCQKDNEYVNAEEIDAEGVPIAFAKLKDRYRPPKPEPSIWWELDIPPGENRDISLYYSIQNDFPLTYGIGKEGLSAHVSEKRKAQAKQLKGYLLFFEQLLANYFSQLAHARELFSADPTIDQTYFYQPLYEVPDVSELFQSVSADAMDWETFKADVSNDYLKVLKDAENREVFHDRRNRFLDHLIARFSEDFTDYALLMLAKAYKYTESDLIADKIAFLMEYPEISSARAKAFNYLATTNGNPDVWDTANVSGFEKRVARLLGIPSYKRRNLRSHAIDDYFFISRDRFNLLDEDLKTLLNGTEAEISEVIHSGTRRDNFKITATEDGRFSFTLFNDKNNEIARGEETFHSPQEAEGAIDAVMQLLADKYTEEGFHLIEHILLRPKRGAVICPSPRPGPPFRLVRERLLPVFPEDAFHDPYSFQVSIFLPAYAAGFQDHNVRRHVTKVLLVELPAHIMAGIYWLNRGDMETFEERFKAWLEAYATIPTTNEEICEITRIQNDLMQTLTNHIETAHE